MQKLRVLGYTVQTHLLVDDGDILTPVPTDPVNVSTTQWPNIVDLMEEARQKLEATLSTPADQDAQDA